MNEPPETRESLILRLPQTADSDAWQEFMSIYQPLVYRLARCQGLQDADAQEVVQEVLLAVSRAVARWTPDPSRGRFRDWLFRITRNLVINFISRQKHRPLARGGSEMEELLEKQCDPACAESALFDLEYRREVFRWAAGEVRSQVNEKTWKAFWQSSVEGRSIVDVARELAMTAGAVYIARSRVMAKLRAVAKQFEMCDAHGAS